MRVVHLSTSQTQGGAAIAAHRLHRGLCGEGVDSHMVVQYAQTDSHRVHPPRFSAVQALSTVRRRADSLPTRLFDASGVRGFSNSLLPGRLLARVRSLEPDVVHLHWIIGSGVSIEQLMGIDVPMVWTIHDLWPITGGCNYPARGCRAFTDACGSCPLLDSSLDRDLSRLNWYRKRRAWQRKDIVAITPSEWAKERFIASTAGEGCRVEVIANGLDTRLFRPHDEETARSHFDLPISGHLILFGAVSSTTDERKGYDLMRQAIRSLGDIDAELVVFGNSDGRRTTELFDSGVRAHFLGRIEDEALLPLLYSAAELMVVPSRCETFGQTASEPLACGTPVVAFRHSGPVDIVDHQANGYLAEPFDPEELASGIEWVLQQVVDGDDLAQNARQKALHCFEQGHVARAHIQLYRDLIGG